MAPTKTPRNRRRLVTILAAILALVAVPLLPVTASAQDTTVSNPLTINWASLLPGFIGPFDPASSDECVSGKDICAKRTIKEMANQLDSLAENCDHNAVFSLAYTRITQGYNWIRTTTNADGSSYYQDTAWLNYVVETFARAYLGAFEKWTAKDPTLPAAWQIAFDAAAAKRATGTGNLLLGINAHINRDLAFVMAASGLVRPDGKSGKPDYDKVNELLLMLTKPLTAELAARLDSSMASGDGSLADPASYQLIVGWRERAWRNAEALASAKTKEEWELTAARIEQDAAAEGALLLASNAYLPPLTTSQKRDAYCAENHFDPAPMSYPFSLK